MKKLMYNSYVELQKLLKNNHVNRGNNLIFPSSTPFQGVRGFVEKNKNDILIFMDQTQLMLTISNDSSSNLSICIW